MSKLDRYLMRKGRMMNSKESSRGSHGEKEDKRWRNERDRERKGLGVSQVGV
jgi:hypothetical protein